MDGQGVVERRWPRALHWMGADGLMGDEVGIDLPVHLQVRVGELANALAAAAHREHLVQQLGHQASSFAIYTKVCRDRGRLGREDPCEE